MFAIRLYVYIFISLEELVYSFAYTYGKAWHLKGDIILNSLLHNNVFIKTY